MTTCGTITSFLVQARAGDKVASDRLFSHVYAELKQIASALIATEAWRRGSSESTALVNAACERLLRNEKLLAENRRHFFFLFSRAMRDVLVEQCRSERAHKNGGGRVRVPLVDFGTDIKSRSANILDVNEALEELRKHDPEAAEVVMLKFFGGHSLTEIAELTNRTFAVVRRDWDYARAWLHDRLSGLAGRRNNS